jgi:rubrerythrin
VATDRTIHYNYGCRRIVVLAGIVKKILLKLVLEDAIIREENAYRFYESALDMVKGEEEQRLLKKLCAEELRHRLKLEELQRSGETEQIDVSSLPEIELIPEQQAWPEVPARASYRDILDLALIKERQAARYYQLIAGRSALRVVKDVFSFLAGEEAQHAHWVQRMLDAS